MDDDAEAINIAWAITGAGECLTESLQAFRKVKEELDPRITTFMSASAEEVTRVYGIREMISHISPGEYYEEVFLQSSQGASSFKTGRFYTGRYAALLIAPATSNSLAKIAHGIADTIVTNAASLALKYKTPVYVLPTDHPKTKETTIPAFLCDREEDIKVKVTPRKVDLENLKKLGSEGVNMLEDPNDIFGICKRLIDERK